MSKIMFRYSSNDLTCCYKIDEVPINDCPMHTHDFYEIYYFVSGECTYLVEGTLYNLKPGDIMIMRPLEAHKCIVNSSNTPYERIIIEIKPDFFSWHIYCTEPKQITNRSERMRRLLNDNGYESAESILNEWNKKGYRNKEDVLKDKSNYRKKKSSTFIDTDLDWLNDD